jgi:hypothetical protein
MRCVDRNGEDFRDNPVPPQIVGRGELIRGLAEEQVAERTPEYGCCSVLSRESNIRRVILVRAEISNGSGA